MIIALPKFIEQDQDAVEDFLLVVTQRAREAIADPVLSIESAKARVNLDAVWTSARLPLATELALSQACGAPAVRQFGGFHHHPFHSL